MAASPRSASQISPCWEFIEQVETILAGRAPAAMAVTEPPGPHYLLVANPETDGLTVLDVETRKLVAIVNVGQQPGHILITPDKQYALVLQSPIFSWAMVADPAEASSAFTSPFNGNRLASGALVPHEVSHSESVGSKSSRRVISAV